MTAPAIDTATLSLPASAADVPPQLDLDLAPAPDLAADVATDAASERAALAREMRHRLRRTLLLMGACFAFLVIFPSAAWAADDGQVNSLIQLALYLGGLSLLPFAIMTLTSFLRIVVVLSFLRSGLGAQNVPPNIVVIALALFLSLFVMGPTIDKINTEALQPFQSKNPETRIGFPEALQRAQTPLKEFMLKQMKGSGSRDEVLTFYDIAQKQKGATCKETDFDKTTGAPKNCLPSKEQLRDPQHGYNALPMRVIIPSFIISELKKAFIMGFAVLLPFLVIDMVISNILLSLGMFMLPPVVISLPFKILLFVLAGGWTMVVKFIVLGFNY